MKSALERWNCHLPAQSRLCLWANELQILALTRLGHTLHAIRGIPTTRKVTVAIAHTLASPARVEVTLTDTTHKVLPVCTHWAVALIFSPLAGGEGSGGCGACAMVGQAGKYAGVERSAELQALGFVGQLQRHFSNVGSDGWGPGSRLN